MNILRLFLYISGANFLYNLVSGPRLILLGYHGVSSVESNEPEHLLVSKDMFRRQILVLKKMGFNFISFSALSGMEKLAKRTAIIYFDDGLRSVYINAYPMMKKMNIPAAIFPVVDYVEKQSTYPYIKEDTKNRDIFLSWEELKKMKDVFEIGTHTVSHRKLADLSDVEIEREMFSSKKIIEAKTNVTVNALSYPKSSFNKRVQEIAQKVGFLFVFANGRGVNKKIMQFLKKIPVGPEDSLIDFKVKIGIWYPFRSIFRAR